MTASIVCHQRVGQVPSRFRDAQRGGARDFGDGKGYAYPHDEPFGVAQQQYVSDFMAHATCYAPASLGGEAQVNERWERVRRIACRDRNG